MVDEETTRYTVATARVDALNQQFKAELERNQLTLSDSQMAVIQQEVRFVNQLAEKRDFSWAQLLHDLEEALPSGISIDKIQRDAKTFTITLDGGASDMRALKALMATLQIRPRFRLPVLHSHMFINSHHGDGGGEDEASGVKFSVTVQYCVIQEKAGQG